MYYFPIEELPTNFIQGKRTVEDHDLYDVVADNTALKEGTLKVYTSGDRAGLFNIQSGAMDAWFEEDEKIYVHPKDPYKV